MNICSYVKRKDITMDVSQVSALITSVGFPIVMCIMLFKYMQELNAQHQEETTALKDAINDLKVAITTLTERLNK